MIYPLQTRQLSLAQSPLLHRCSRAPPKDTMIKNICNTILWLLILIFIAYPIATFVLWIYILVQPFAVCLRVEKIKESIEYLVTLPRKCAENIVGGKEVAGCAQIASSICNTTIWSLVLILLAWPSAFAG
ncbi:hypothetical protein EGW08_015549 [Elysia chlorotica]|uniref:Uncharacterized protein n=1 Tax=Elysia chlorotica TaxID=188477 RepID=A0A433T584_ELYCH|nr:hypothetical protein EGW08_015549 [Elysia chlorotica]